MADHNTTCFVDNVKCNISDGTLVEMHIETTWQECSVLCQDEVRCVAFNFFGLGSDFYPRSSCLLFSACERKAACNDCVIGTNQDDCTCSIDYYGEIDKSNFVEAVASVPDEVTCKNFCSKATHCAFYTYYNSQHPYQPEVCILLSNPGIEKSQIDNSRRGKSGLQSSAKKCDNCKTGPVSCEINQECKVALLTSNDQAHPYIFAESNHTKVTLVTGEKSCFREMRVLAIGGGGSSGFRSGGGSGHPELNLLQLRSNETLSLTVGPGIETMIEKDGVELLIGAKGQNGNDAKGGDGYSGGGAGFDKSNTGKDGGSDGSDGHSSGGILGGKGSGLDLTTLNMARFVLTPGKAGTGFKNFGGGGGGILVNGKRPQDGRNRYDGEGFGGGRGASKNYGYSKPIGFPGCVLIEI